MRFRSCRVSRGWPGRSGPCAAAACICGRSRWLASTGPSPAGRPPGWAGAGSCDRLRLPARWSPACPASCGACRAPSRGRDRIRLRVWPCGSISPMTGLTDASGAFGYGDSILAGERVRLRGVRDDDLPTLAKWEMDPGRMATLSNWVAPPSEAAAKERIAKWSANEKDDLGFAIETLEDPPVLVGNIGLWGARPKDRCATLGIALGREYIGRGYGTDAMRV